MGYNHSVITKKSLGFWVLLKLGLILLVAFVAGQTIPYLGFFSFPKTLTKYALPPFVRALANFDGIHYLRIAKIGYVEFQQAFFPLYPLLLREVGKFLAGNYLLSGLLVSNLSFWVGLYFFNRTFAKKETAKYLVASVLLFPTAFFFQTVYTEGLFFLWLAVFFYLVKKKAYFWAGIVGGLASATRLVGIFLCLPLFLAAWQNKKPRLVLFALLPILGLASYMFYLYVAVGNPFAFVTSQSAFGAGRSTTVILLPQVYWRYLKIFLTVEPGFVYFVAAMECIFFTAVFLVCLFEAYRHYRARQFLPLSLALFSLVNILLPTLTGTFLSVPRFALTSPAIFYAFSTLKSPLLKIGLLVIFTLLQIVFLSLFVQGYFIS